MRPGRPVRMRFISPTESAHRSPGAHGGLGRIRRMDDGCSSGREPPIPDAVQHRVVGGGRLPSTRWWYPGPEGIRLARVGDATSPECGRSGVGGDPTGSGQRMNKLYEFFAEVTRDVDGTRFFAPCYSSALDHEKALEKGVGEMFRLGLSLRDIRGGVREISVSRWDAHVSAIWPGFEGVMPDGKSVHILVAEGRTFLGPLMGSNDERGHRSTRRRRPSCQA